MLRISKLTDYATLILARLAARPGKLQTAAEVAADTHVALPTVSKLLKALQRHGLVTSVRGSHGGYQLTRPASQITAASILDALEGPVAITECSGEHSACEIAGTCRVGHSWQRVNVAIRRVLNDISLAQLAGVERPRADIQDAGVAIALPLTRVTRAPTE